MLVHEVADDVGSRRRAARPSALFVAGDQARLRCEPGKVGRIDRRHQSIDKLARTGQFRVTVDHDQGCIHYTNLRIDPIVFGMRSEESDHQDACLVIEGSDQPIVVAFDIEHQRGRL